MNITNIVSKILPTRAHTFTRITEILKNDLTYIYIYIYKAPKFRGGLNLEGESKVVVLWMHA